MADREVVRLPSELVPGPELLALNRRLRENAITLDWSDVRRVTENAAATLLGGVDLSVLEGAIGAGTLSNAVADVVSRAMDRIEAGSRPSRPARPVEAPGNATLLGSPGLTGTVSDRPRKIDGALHALEQAPADETAPTTSDLPDAAPAVPSKLLAVPKADVLRAELLGRVVADLFGPAGGPEEEIDENSVRDRYIVGMLAPRAHGLVLEEFDDSGVETGTDRQDGAPEPETPQGQSMFPSSIGFTFAVAKRVSSFRVSASWGQ